MLVLPTTLARGIFSLRHFWLEAFLCAPPSAHMLWRALPPAPFVFSPCCWSSSSAPVSLVGHPIFTLRRSSNTSAGFCCKQGHHRMPHLFVTHANIHDSCVSVPHRLQRSAKQRMRTADDDAYELHLRVNAHTVSIQFVVRPCTKLRPPSALRALGSAACGCACERAPCLRLPQRHAAARPLQNCEARRVLCGSPLRVACVPPARPWPRARVVAPEKQPS